MRTPSQRLDNHKFSAGGTSELGLLVSQRQSRGTFVERQFFCGFFGLQLAASGWSAFWAQIDKLTSLRRSPMNFLRWVWKQGLETLSA